MERCNFNETASGFAREVGCPLDHCRCGTHDVDQKDHKCPEDGDMDDPMDAYCDGSP